MMEWLALQIENTGNTKNPSSGQIMSANESEMEQRGSTSDEEIKYDPVKHREKLAGSGIFAVGGVMERAAAEILETPVRRRSADRILDCGARLGRRSLQPTKLNLTH